MKILGLSLITLSFFAIGCSHYGKKCNKDRAAKYFSKMDTNADGSITKKEFDTKSKDKWTALDADKNGKVTMEEFKAYKKAKKGECKKSKCSKCSKKGCSGC